MSLGVLQEQNFPWKWKPQNFALTFISLIFRYEILYAKYVDLLDKLKKVKNSQFFSTVLQFSELIKIFSYIFTKKIVNSPKKGQKNRKS
jgi:hypothetical protein